LAIDVELADGAAPKPSSVAIQDDCVLERRGLDVRLPNVPHNARFGHQEHTINGHLKPVATDN
jgi:hypothetical protein